MSRFLPKSVPGQDYALARPRPNDFTPSAANFLQDLGRKMKVSRARSEGRVPSPLSRAFVFFLNLYGKGFQPGAEGIAEVDIGRKALQAEARRTFRGICSVFALRDVFGLKVQIESVSLDPNGSSLEQVLLTAVQAGPRGGQHWSPLRFYTIAPDDHTPWEVFAGVSPLTGIFPAGQPPNRLTPLFWYDADAGRWYDPTSSKLTEDGEFHLTNPRTLPKVRQLLRGWVAKATELAGAEDAFKDLGFASVDRVALRNELALWLAELGGAVSSAHLTRSPLPGAEKADQGGPSFADYVCTGTPEDLIGDVPMFRGKLVVTREQLLQPSTRLYGRSFGSAAWAKIAEQLPRSGDNLGSALGLRPEAIPVGYVLVDQLFTKKLVMVTERGLGDGWNALKIGDQYYLIPLDPEVLHYLPPDELAGCVTGKKDSAYITVNLTFGAQTISRRYAISANDEYALDDITIPAEYLDLRVFPDFDLDSVSDGIPEFELGNEDRKYYARVRWNPAWDFTVSAFRYDETARVVTEEFGSRVRLGTAKLRAEPGKYHPGQVELLTLSEKPSGFFFQGRGLCLITFPEATGQAAKWQVGVDFGTSNTCVTYRTAASDAKVLPLPVLTTTFLRTPEYSAEFNGPHGSRVSERASALLDFFFKQQHEDVQLAPEQFFPTQVVTKYDDVRNEWSWNFEGGLIYFKNISLAYPIIWELIDTYPIRDPKAKLQPEKRFRVKQDIKWEERAWLELFMQHLRKQVILTAAKKRGKVDRVHLSYPKAFSFLQKQDFLRAVDRVWSQPDRPDAVQTRSESEAVRNIVVREAQEYVVFDIGGGTTDIVAFRDKRPVWQTSFRLAAGKINRYVAQSIPFRSALLDEFMAEFKETKLPEHILELFIGSVEAAGRKLVVTTWLGLLELIEQADADGKKLQNILIGLRQRDGDSSADDVRAITGFFLSVAVLFGGLAYFAGMLSWAASSGRFSERRGATDFIELILSGNGSKLYRFLDHPEAQFASVIREMFRAGLNVMQRSTAAANKTSETAGRVTAPLNSVSAGASGGAEGVKIKFDGVFKLGDRSAPKVTVALGLLTPAPPAWKDPDSAIPIANIIGEVQYPMMDPGAGYEGDLVKFYTTLYEKQSEFAAPVLPPDCFADCIKQLSALLPSGVNKKLPVISRIGKDWHDGVLSQLYPPSRLRIKTRLQDNANRLAEDRRNDRFSEDDIPAQEPVFIVELAALLDQIREQYAGTGA